MAFWFGWLGRLTAAISIYNLVSAHIYRMPVDDLFRAILSYYRSIFYFPVDIIKNLAEKIRIPLHVIPNDLIILYVIGGASLCRFALYGRTQDARLNAFHDLPRSPLRKFESLTLLLITWPALIVAFLIAENLTLLDAQNPARQGWEVRRQAAEYLVGGMTIEFLKAVGIFLLFFLFNAATPSAPLSRAVTNHPVTPRKNVEKIKAVEAQHKAKNDMAPVKMLWTYVYTLWNKRTGSVWSAPNNNDGRSHVNVLSSCDVGVNGIGKYKFKFKNISATDTLRFSFSKIYDFSSPPAQAEIEESWPVTLAPGKVSDIYISTRTYDCAHQRVIIYRKAAG